jgi:hypothetical protein
MSEEAPPPDWDVASGDVRCPLCEYDLRGLVEPRCPECGYTFTWPEITDPTRRRHPYLFEHHGDRNVWSFRRTLLAGLRPGRFWRSLSPAQPSFAGRLAAYAAAVLLGILVLSPVAVLTYTAAVLLLSRSIGGTWGDAFEWAWRVRGTMPVLILVAYYVLWAVSTLMALLIFRISMRRARIRPVHVVRCVVYGFDAGLWAAAGLLVLAMALAALEILRVRGFSDLAYVGAGVPWLLVAAVFYRLVSAYRHYLRFDRPFLTVLASQVIAWLVVINVALW